MQTQSATLNPVPEPSDAATFVARLPNGQQALVASRDLPASFTVARFEGPVVRWNEVPPEEVNHALLLQGDDWMLPRTEARYINHSCAPNCRVGEDLAVVTTRPVRPGEQLTFSYDRLSMEEFLRAPQHYFWDPRWSFDCECGQPGCVGRIDRYRIHGGEEVAPVAHGRKIRLGIMAGQGRGVFASAAIAGGETIELAPVVVSPAQEWEHLERTALYHYAFSWGPNLEHAAIALGFASLYNHSFTPNAVYRRRLDDLLIEIVALRDIAAGEHITVNYNGEPDDRSPLWFDPS